MMQGFRIKLPLFACCAMLTACQSSVPLNNPVAAAALETAEALCEVWQKAEPSWADEDTEQTKDEIDYSIRVRENVCEQFK